MNEANSARPLVESGNTLRLQRQPGSDARPQGMKQDASGRFHGMARLPAEGAHRNDFNVIGIIGMDAGKWGNKGMAKFYRLAASPWRRLQAGTERWNRYVVMVSEPFA